MRSRESGPDGHRQIEIGGSASGSFSPPSRQWKQMPSPLQRPQRSHIIIRDVMPLPLQLGQTLLPAHMRHGRVGGLGHSPLRLPQAA